MPNDRSIATSPWGCRVRAWNAHLWGGLGVLAGDTIRESRRRPIDVQRITRKRK